MYIMKRYFNGIIIKLLLKIVPWIFFLFEGFVFILIRGFIMHFHKCITNNLGSYHIISI